VNIVFSQSAFGDLELIQNYYSEQGVPKVGKRFQLEIFARIQQLETHPELGRIVPELNTPSVREIIYPPFRIVYVKEAMQIKIVRVWRSERLLVLPSID
jgi:plasmid stabilization system protein ParE